MAAGPFGSPPPQQAYGAPPGPAGPPVGAPPGPAPIYPGYPQQQQTGPYNGTPQYDMETNAPILRKHPSYADPRRFKFTGKMLFGLIATFSVIFFFVGAVFMALIFESAVKVLNAVFEALYVGEPALTLLDLILMFL